MMWQWTLGEWAVFQAMTVVFLSVVGLIIHVIMLSLEGRDEMGFTVKDSGKREQFSSGMVRDTADDKVNFVLVADGPMLRRWADHLTKGARKYAKRNWMKAEGQEELERFCDSAFRHFIQWVSGETDEDHAAAVIFNINGAEYVREKMARQEALDAALEEAGAIQGTPSRPTGGWFDLTAHLDACPGCPQCIYTTTEVP